LNDNGKTTLVVFGLDSEDKPHASRFTQDDREAAMTAARLMGFNCAEITDPGLVQVVEALPQGRIYATGRALVPFVKRELYDKLAALPLPVAPAAPEGHKEQQTPEATAKLPQAVTEVAEVTGVTEATEAIAVDPPAPTTDYWAAIELGSVILANDRASENGWWEAVVIEVGSDPDILTVAWTEFPKEPTFKVKRRDTAVMSTGVAPPVKKPGKR